MACPDAARVINVETLPLIHQAIARGRAIFGADFLINREVTLAPGPREAFGRKRKMVRTNTRRSTLTDALATCLRQHATG